MDESVQSPEINTFSLVALRDRLLPDLLQDDESNILYWAGKSLARREEFSSITAIEIYFSRIGFGNLKALGHKGTEIKWELTGPIVGARLAERTEASFYLEAGFLAQALETLSGVGTEAQVNVADDIATFDVLTESSVDLPI
ncbi:putative hydrocarbon binding protein [Weissella uvarum]|uniref:DUF2507 domain-containing protein n=1 Tax=Weissella uvarum TaxID=1479233 RepID=UPI001961014B|nr:DUF2507 domain-containing protein [Weissella uvarum]MBM7617441.1 putative hydrocarbon binding protein [Weissella uvarum]MCM0595674.1 DUF2507 domain-containing protein [Weissella uvarum]